MDHVRGGYRVWLDRGRDCFWVPDARFLLWPFHVGLSVRFGGGWDSAGYYDVYDTGPAIGSYGSYGSYGSGSYGAYGSYNSTAVLQGVVESVDYDRGIVVVRDTTYGRFSTVLLRGNDPRLGDLRPGEFVILSGSWDRGGTFTAYGVEDLRDR